MKKEREKNEQVVQESNVERKDKPIKFIWKVFQFFFLKKKIAKLLALFTILRFILSLTHSYKPTCKVTGITIYKLL